MDKYQIIGRGVRSSWPHEIAVHWPGKDLGGPVMLTEGMGHGSAGGNFALAEILDEKWNDNLGICDCLWLRDLAREEAERSTLFSADEIWERAQERNR